MDGALVRNRLIIVLVIILFLAYHIVYNAYIHSLFNEHHGYVFWFGMYVHASFFIDLILYCSLGLLILLMVMEDR